jgi:ABC-2 type transport system ATP-binding protein
MVHAIRVCGLVKTYPARPPVEAVRGLDLDVYVGECFGLLGPNGAGKTTTLDSIEGLLDPTAGQVDLLERRWGENDVEIRRKIGISLQETRFSDKLTVRETDSLFRSFNSSGPTPEEAIPAVSLEDKARSYVDKL